MDDRTNPGVATAPAPEAHQPDEPVEAARDVLTLAGVGALAAAAALAGCGGGGGGGTGSGSVPPPAPAPAPAPAALDPADTAAARLLLHAQVAATEADIAAVRAMGAPAWLDAQLALPVGEKAYDWLVAKGYGTIDDNSFYDNDYGLDFAIAYQVIRLPDTVRKRVALALSELFVISIVGLGTMPWRTLGVGHYWDLLNAHAFGDFRTLLEAVTLNPAMGLYLNTKGNAKEDPATGRVPDENYAREVMQLFTLGLEKLNIDGTPMLDGAGRSMATYTQDDVTQLARVFTGYDLWDDGRRFPAKDGFPRPYQEYSRQPMVFKAAQHSMLAATFLGTTVPANTDGASALRIALDTLFNHPNVGPFFARQMIQRLVTSNPSPAYVARVATRFNDNGAGVRGDLRAVWRAILLDDEAQGAGGLVSPTHGKVREPMIRVFQWARTFNLQSVLGQWKFGFDYGNPQYWYDQRPFYSGSVFNFFRPGYVPPGSALAATGATAPEFQIVNETTVSQWVNSIELVATSGIYVVWPDRPGFPQPYAGPYPGDGYDLVPDHTPEIALAHDPAALVRRLNLLLCAGQLSADTQARIVAMLSDGSTLSAASPAAQKRQLVGAAVTLVMCSPEYVVQK